MRLNSWFKCLESTKTVRLVASTWTIFNPSSISRSATTGPNAMWTASFLKLKRQLAHTTNRLFWTQNWWINTSSTDSREEKNTSFWNWPSKTPRPWTVWKICGMITETVNPENPVKWNCFSTHPKPAFLWNYTKAISPLCSVIFIFTTSVRLDGYTFLSIKCSHRPSNPRHVNTNICVWQINSNR